ncbi:MAG: GerAB/ArcD/ProY family transporter [Oscillospiraceae bacterium]|jgi:spore germination protein (amino acid permease)|nr:GerAB/ArcD/ProY family transporter [Oscillospiraceae bacterium]
MSNGNNNKISSRQLAVMYIISVLSPATRLFPSVCARYGKTAGWVGVVVAALGTLALGAAFSAWFKKSAAYPTDLGGIIETAFGRIAGRVLLAVYFLWLLVLYLTYISYYAARLLSTIFTTADIRFFVVTMMFVCLIAAHGRLESLGRFAEFAVIIFVVAFIAFYLFLIPTFKLRNVWPVTYLDAVPILRASYPVVSILGYFSIFLFLGGQIADRAVFPKSAKRGILLLGVLTVLMTASCIGTLGYAVARRMPLPFFSATKLINILQSFDRLEALLLSIWVISDFVMLASLVFILANLLRKLFNVREERYFATPIVFFGIVGGIFFAMSRSELEAFSFSRFTMTFNVATGIILPCAAMLVGHLRLRKREHLAPTPPP